MSSQQARLIIALLAGIEGNTCENQTAALAFYIIGCLSFIGLIVEMLFFSKSKPSAPIESLDTDNRTEPK